MSSKTQTFSKVENDEKNKVFRIKTEWGDEDFEMCILEDDTAWYAAVAKDYIKELAEQHELQHDIYLRNIREFIANNKSSSITFTIANNEFIIYHGIKKEKLRMKYFIVKLQQVDYQETAKQFVDSLLSRQEQLHQESEALQTEKLDIEHKKMLYEKKLNDYVELKRKSDHEMYNCFTLLLNEKKRRICFLSELLDSEYGEKLRKKTEALKESEMCNTKSSSNNCTQFQAKPSTSKRKHSISGSDNEPDSDTDAGSSMGYNTDEEGKKLNFLQDTLDDSLELYTISKRIKPNYKNNVIEKDAQVEKIDESIEFQNQSNNEEQIKSNKKEENSDEELNTQDLLDNL